MYRLFILKIKEGMSIIDYNKKKYFNYKLVEFCRSNLYQ